MDALEREIDKPKGCGMCLGVRHFQVVLQMLFYVIIFGIQIVFSITLFSMTESHKIMSEMPFNKISLLMESYLFAYVPALLFGGWFCKKFGFKWPMVLLMVIIATVTINLPLITKEYGYHGAMFCRIVQGICAGLLFPFPAEVVSRWVPIQERTILGTAVYASNILGITAGSLLGGYLTVKFSWSFVYTIYGYMAVVWAILMTIFGANSPEEYTRGISQYELNYIIQNRGEARPKSKVKIPWMRILKSVPFWSIVVAQIGHFWMLTVSPMYILTIMRSHFDVPMKIHLALMAISWVSTIVISGIAEFLIYRKTTTIQQSRKIFNSIGSLIPAFSYLFLIIIPHGDVLVGVVIWTTISVASVAIISGSTLNVNDITSNFAPIVYGLASGMGMIVSLCGYMVLSRYMFYNWNAALSISIAVIVITNWFYLMYGSGQEQEWDGYDEIDQQEEFSKSTSYAAKAEEKYLLFEGKQ